MRENNNTAMENEMNKMKVRNLRWGESCGGMACGPIEGSSVVELCVTWKGGTYFIADVPPERIGYPGRLSGQGTARSGDYRQRPAVHERDAR